MTSSRTEYLREYSRRWRTEHPDYWKNRSNSLEQKEKNRQYFRTWYESERGRLYVEKLRGSEKLQKKRKLEKQRHPDKYRARKLLNRAVQDGKIEKKPCCVCGDHNSQGHHEDYLKPLEVTWLCSLHHGEAHRMLVH